LLVFTTGFAKNADMLLKFAKDAGLVVDVSDTKRIFYEFKSTKDVPLDEFAEQFIKDLSIADDLDQIKWIFDGKKVTSLDKAKFLDKLRNSGLYNNKRLFEQYYKVEFRNVDALLNTLKNNDDWFNLIFKIK
jgi:hypothetical protein